VITVLGPRNAGQVEVATFRVDAAYTDGRHPAGVTFCSASEDAQRRDFTINGLFLDPLSGEVHDYVGGRDDLTAGIVRAIGEPARRFAEDHLRMLRAIRFTAFFGFVLEAQTRAAIERMTHLVAGVSPERIAAELRAMTSRPGRGLALHLLEATGLAREVLPDLAPGPAHEAPSRASWNAAALVVDALDEPDLPLALAALAEGRADDPLPAVAGRLRLSVREAKKAAWLTEAVAALGDASRDGLATRPWSRVQPFVAHEHASSLADLLRARAACGRGAADAAAWFTAQVSRPRHEIDPPPLVTGADLLAAGVAEGPALGAALARVRALQLDGHVTSREQAIAEAMRAVS